MNADLFVDESPIHGRGLFARSTIESETHLGDYEGEITREEGTYVLWYQTDDGEWEGIDGRNELRFVNHSDEPNSEFRGEELWTLRQILPGEEITHDYSCGEESCGEELFDEEHDAFDAASFEAEADAEFDVDAIAADVYDASS